MGTEKGDKGVISEETKVSLLLCVFIIFAVLAPFFLSSKPEMEGVVKEYLNTTEPVIEDFSAHFEEFNRLHIVGGEDHFGTISDEWKSDVVSSFSGMNEAMETFRTISPPDRMKVYHSHILLAFNEADFMTLNYLEAIDDLGSELMSEWILSVARMTLHFESAIKDKRAYLDYYR